MNEAPSTPLLEHDLVERVAHLRVRAQRAVEGLRSGIHQSPHRGASVIFAEHRDYRPGDDLRLLDWRAYARSDRHIIKRFEQETHLRAQLWLDVSASMAYDGGTPEQQKHAHAATLLAAIGFVLLGQGDAVGAITFAQKVREAVPARARPGQLDAVCTLLAQPPALDARTDLHAALLACTERAGRRGLVVIASDLLDLSVSALDPLTLLRAKGHDVIVLHVLHPHELDLPFKDRMRVTDPEGDGVLDTDPDAVRDAYLSRLSEFLVACNRRCTAAGARYVLARTDKELHQTIAQALSTKVQRSWA